MNNGVNFTAEIVYPKTIDKGVKRYIAKKILLLCFIVGGLTCFIVNICVKGTPWFLIVIGGELLVWVSIIYKPKIDYNIIQKTTQATYTLCGYLILINLIFGHKWAWFVVPIIGFALLIVIGLFYFVHFKSQRRNFLPLFIIVISSLIVTVFSIIFQFTSWPIIVLGSIALGVLLVSCVVFAKPIAKEFKKKFHAE